MAFDFSKIFSSIKLNLPQKSGRNMIGVDIGTSAIKVVQIHDEDNVPTLDTYGELQLGPYEGKEIGHTTSLSKEKLIEAFADILREASVTSTEVSVAISYGSSFATIITVPTTDEQQISAIMPVEARKYIPVSLNEVTLDWFPVAHHQDSKSSQVLLAAIHHDALKKYQSIMTATKLHNAYTEIETFSVIRSSVSQNDNTVALLDCGAGATKLYVTRRGLIGKMHSIRQGGSALSEHIASLLTIPFNTAEDLKRTEGLHVASRNESVQKELYKYFDRGFHELRQIIQEYTTEENTKLEKVILSGSGALLLGFDEYVQDRLQLPVTRANPFSKVAYPAFLEDTLTRAGPTFTVALGAALRLMTERK